MEYTIAGRLKKYIGTDKENEYYMIYVAGTNKEHAEKLRQETEKTEHDYYDIIVGEVPEEECWWNYGTD